MASLMDIANSISLKGSVVKDSHLYVAREKERALYGCDCGACDDGGYCIDSECA